MSRFWLFIPLLLIASAWLSGCDEGPAEPDAAFAAAQESGTPSFKKDRPPAAEPNPIGCSQDQVAKWDDTSGEWVCANDLVGPAGTVTTLFASVHCLDEVCKVKAQAGLAGWTKTGTGSHSLTFDRDISTCATVASIDMEYPTRTHVEIANLGKTGMTHLDRLLVETWRDNDSTRYDGSFSVMLVCNPT